MKKNTIFSYKYLMLLVLSFYSLNLFAQTNPNDGSVNLGKIPVYKFIMDSLRYDDGKKRLDAVGTEYMAELYIYNIGGNTFFNIIIDRESFVITDNPYGKRVSPHSYHHSYIYRDGRYEQSPELTHKAGSYFLALPNSYSNANKNEKDQAPNTSKAKEKAEPEWQLLGKVRLYSNMRKVYGSGEDDVIFDEETAFLYSSYSESKVKYRISIPKSGEQYDVYENSSYNGSQVQWNSRGTRVRYMPGISEMFTHYAGKYYFDVDKVRP